jgi:Cys-rich repeat protein
MTDRGYGTGWGWRSPLGARAVMLGALLGSLACELYEGRSLDLFERSFPPECQQASGCGGASLCVAGRCVECETDRQCSGGKPVCSGGTCVECATDAGCPAGERCNAASRTCALGCAEASQCAGQKESRCRLDVGYCVECFDVAHCASRGKLACDLGPGLCVACIGDSDCQAPDPRCDLGERRCVECLADGDCGDGRCDLARRRCVECLEDAHCPGGATCGDGSRCQLPCVGDDGCDAAHPRCQATTGACVGCLTDADCTESKAPACNESGECVECVGDVQCLESTRPACVVSRGRCAECTRAEHCSPDQTCDLQSTRCQSASE